MNDHTAKAGDCRGYSLVTATVAKEIKGRLKKETIAAVAKQFK
jgi:hypothetical protein